jgi:DNA-binding CsgD family transcriptional regulator
VLVAVGFGLTILIDLLYTWGGWVFDTATLFGLRELFLVWSVPHQLTNALVFVLLALFAKRIGRRHLKVVLSAGAALLVSGHLLLLSSGIVPVAPSVAITAAALLIGTGTSFLLACWILLFAEFTVDESYVLILSALALYAVLFLIVSNLPTPLFAASPLVLIPATVVFAFCALRSGIGAESWTPESASVSAGATTPEESEALEESAAPGEPATRQAEHSAALRVPLLRSVIMLRNPLFCATSIVFAVPLTRISALVDFVDVEWMNAVTAVVIIVVCASLFLLRYGPGRNAALSVELDIPRLFKFSLPLVATALVLYTVVGSPLSLPVSVAVFVLFYLVWLLMIPTCIQTSQRLGMSPLVAYGTASCIVNLVLALATWLGTILLTGELFFGAATLSVCMLLVLYVLMMTFTFQGRRTQLKRRAGGREPRLPDAPVPRFADGHALMPPSSTELLCKSLVEQHLLTPRECDILLLLAQGRDAPYSANRLFISKNTVRTHIKSVYVKIDVHSRQELLDLLESLQDPQPQHNE